MLHNLWVRSEQERLSFVLFTILPNVVQVWLHLNVCVPFEEEHGKQALQDRLQIKGSSLNLTSVLFFFVILIFIVLIPISIVVIVISVTVLATIAFPFAFTWALTLLWLCLLVLLFLSNLFGDSLELLLVLLESLLFLGVDSLDCLVPNLICYLVQHALELPDVKSERSLQIQTLEQMHNEWVTWKHID